MPGNYGIGFDDQEYVLPARPKAAERNPEQPVETIQWRPGPFALEDGQLLSESDDLERSDSARTKEDAYSRKDRNEEIEQLPL